MSFQSSLEAIRFLLISECEWQGILCSGTVVGKRTLTIGCSKYITNGLLSLLNTEKFGSNIIQSTNIGYKTQVKYVRTFS